MWQICSSRDISPAERVPSWNLRCKISRVYADEVEAEDVQRAKQLLPPPYAELADLLHALEVRAADACMDDVSLLQKTKMVWIRTESKRKAKQSDIRSFSEAQAICSAPMTLRGRIIRRNRRHGGKNSVGNESSTRNNQESLASYGSTFYANGYDDGNKDGLVLMQTVSGVAEDGRAVVAVVPPGRSPAGSSIVADSRYVLDKPEGVDWNRAAMLPFLAVNCLCPLVDAGFAESKARGQSFVVTGGHGSVAPFLVQVLKAWGGRVSCVTVRDQRAVEALGAESTVDFRQESFSDRVTDISVVVDTLGREKESAQRMLREAKGAEYVSLQPRALEVAIEEGLLFGAPKILQYQRTVARDDARTYFLPNAEAMEVVSRIARMISSKTVELGSVGTEYVGMQEYLEALSWPKDSDTGLRYGFPGKTSRVWGWLGGDVDEEDNFPWANEDDGEDEQDDAGTIRVMASDRVRLAVPTGEVVRVKSREDLEALTEEGGTVIFVSAKGCRACKFLTPFYRKLAQKEQQLWFGRVDASANPELARDLGLKAVPSFVTFRAGARVTSASTSSREKIERLVEELLYD